MRGALRSFTILKNPMPHTGMDWGDMSNTEYGAERRVGDEDRVLGGYTSWVRSVLITRHTISLVLA